MKKKIFIVAAVIFSSRLQAQQTDQTLHEDSIGRQLDEVVVTTGKYPRKQSETGKIITVISRQQLEKNMGKSISEVLNTLAGVTIIGTNNALGTNNTTSIRGASAGNALILMDGMPLNDPSVNNNYFDLNYFAIDQVERIEILKGGQSTLYGSDAVAGVINIISKRSAKEKINITGSLSAGSFNTFQQYIGAGGRNKLLDYSIHYTHLNSKGFSTAYDSSKTGNFDNDKFNQHVASASFGFQISRKLKAYIFNSYTFYKTDLDASAFTDEKDYDVKNNNVRTGAGLKLDHQKGSLKFTYSFNYTERNYLDDSTYKSSPFVDFAIQNYIGRTHYAELYNNWKWNNWEVVAGGDYRLHNTFQFYFSTGSWGPYAPPAWTAKINQVSPYASVVYKTNGFTGEIGGRLNVHSEYGTNFTYTFNPSYLINNNVKVFANFYSAFKTPTLYQLFDPSAGNADLKPEKGNIEEAGIEIFQNQSFHARLAGFYRLTKDAIVFTFNPNTYTSKYLNVSSQKNYGTEAEIRYSAGKVTITTNYTYTDGATTSAYDGTGAPIGKDTTYYNLYRIPKHAFNLNMGFQVTKSFFASTNIRSVSKRQEFIYGSAPETLNGYTIINLYGEYKLKHKIKLFLDLKNITNKEYFDLLGYNSKKFNFTGGLHFNL